MKKICLFILTFLLLFSFNLDNVHGQCTSGPLAAGTYTIDKTLPISATNFQSIKDAVDLLNDCGVSGPVIFNINGSNTPYTDQLIFENIAGASATNKIRFNGNGVKIEYTPTGTNNMSAIIFDSTGYVTLDSFNIILKNASYGWGLTITNNSKFDSLTRSIIDLTALTTSSTNYGVGVAITSSTTSPTSSGTNGSNIYIGNNNILGNPNSLYGNYYGITMYGSNATSNMDNVFENNEIANFYYYGLSFNYGTNTIIHNNNIHKSTKTGMTSGYGMYVVNSNPGLVITNNKIHSLHGATPNNANSSTMSPMYLSASGTATNTILIANNAIYNNLMNINNAIYASGSYSNYYHNSVDMSYYNANTNTEYGIISYATSSEFKNNVINITNGTNAVVYGIYFANSLTNGNIAKNVVNVNSPSAGSNFAYYYGGNNFTTLQAFQTAYPLMEVGSVSFNPMFTNPSIGNLMPQAGMIYQLGANLAGAVNNDITGLGRNVTAPTPGAYEKNSIINNDMATLEKVSPIITCGGNTPIVVKFANAGNNVVDSFRVNWSVNNVNQTVYLHNASLYPNNMPNTPKTVNLTIGNINFLPNQIYNVKVWVSHPNGTQDVSAFNDTITFSLKGGMSGTFTINQNIPASATNYTSLSAFVDDLNNYGICGPVIGNVVAGSGPYNDKIALNNVAGTSAVNTIKINGNGNVINVPTLSYAPHFILLNATSYVKIDSFNFISSNPSFGWGASITNNSNYDTIANCVFNFENITSTGSNATNGITFSGSALSPTSTGSGGNYNVIINNKFLGSKTSTGSLYYGIAIVTGSTNNIIANNEIANFYAYGVYISSTPDNKILNNEIHRSTKQVNITTTSYGIYMINNSAGTIIANNKIHSFGGLTGTSTSSANGIYLLTSHGSAAKPNLIYNNVIYNLNHNATVYGIYSSSTSYLKIYHNTISIDNLIASTNTTYGVYFSGSQTGTELKNNIITIKGGGTGIRYGYYLTATNGVATNGLQRNNVFVTSTQPGTSYHSYYGANRLTLAALQTAYPAMEAGSLSIDPLYANLAVGNLKPSMAAIGLNVNGENLNASVASDIIGTTRKTNPTPGAWELADAILNNAGIISINSEICAGLQPVNVTLINDGSNNLTSAQINWSVDNVMQTPFIYSGNLASSSNINNLPFTANVIIGNYNFTGHHDLKVWTSLPNNSIDNDPTNDTQSISYHAKLNGVYTINKNAPASNSNFVSFDSLTKALNVYGVCGPVVVNVVTGSGAYNEFVEFKSIPGSSAINTITINGNNNVVSYNNDINNRYLLIMNGTSYVKIDNLKFKSLNANYGLGALFYNGSRFDSLTNCDFDLTMTTTSSSTSSSGLVFSSSLTSTSSTSAVGGIATRCYIAGNKFRGPSSSMYGMYYGLMLNTGADTNIIHNNEFSDFYIYGINLNGSNNYNKIIANNIHRSTKSSVTTFYGINTVSGNMPGLEIVGNRIHNPKGISSTTGITYYGLYLQGDGIVGDSILVANNLIYNINAGGQNGVYVNGALYNNIYHNTISFEQTISYGVTNYGAYFTGTNTGTKFMNNIITFHGGGTSIKYGYYLSATSSLTPANVQRNNIFFNTSQTGAIYHSYMGANRATLAALQTAYPAMEVGSLSTDPFYENPAIGNFKPSILGFAIAQNGLNLNASVPNDILNIIRTNTPTVGAYELNDIVANNAAADSLVSPIGFCAGTYPIVVTIKNVGTNNISSIQVNWTLNGVPQTPVAYNTVITSPLNNLASSYAQVTLPNATLLNGDNNLVYWTSLPNNVQDNVPANDTNKAILKSGLIGNFTINQNVAASATNFISISEFAAALNKRGVCGPVVANVASGSGPYTESVQFNDIQGASAINTISLKGNGEMMQYNPSGTNDMRMFVLNGTKYFTVDSLNINGLSPNYGWGFHIYNGASFDTIRNCYVDFSLATNSSSNTFTGLAISSSTTSPTATGNNANDIYIVNNKFQVGSATSAYGAYYGISIVGNSAALGGADNITFKNNEIFNFYYYGLYLSNTKNAVIDGNDIHKSSKTNIVTTVYGLYSTGDQGSKFINNRIHNFSAPNVQYSGTSYAMYFNAPNNSVNTNPILIANNAIYNMNTYAGTQAGIYIASGVNLRVIHNTVNFDHANTLSNTNTMYGIYMTGSGNSTIVKNNNVVFTGGNTGTKYGMYYGSTAMIAAAGLQYNNVFMNSSQSGTQYHSYYNGNYATLAAFKAAYPAMETASLSVNPSFVNAVAGNLAPQNATLIGSGENLTNLIASDIIGIPRSLGSTPGAFERAKAAGLDIEMVAIIDPNSPICTGTHQVKVVILNYGNVRAQNFQIDYSLNGAAPNSYIYSNMLDTIGGVGKVMDTVIIGNVTIPIGTHTLSIWLNNILDVNKSNDTIAKQINTQNFTIDLLSDTICNNTTSDVFVVNGAGLGLNNITWYESVDNINYNINASTNNPNLSNLNLTNDLYYTATVNLGNVSCNTDTVKQIVVNPTLQVINDTLICNPISVTLSANASNANTVLWYANATGGAPLFVGNPFITPLVTQSITYYVSAGFESGLVNCYSDRQPVFLKLSNTPVVDLGPDYSLCVNPTDIDFLDAQNPGYTYLWDNNYLGQVRVINSSGQYYVAVTNQDGCVGTDTINVTFNPNPAVDLGNDTSVCINTPLTINAGNTGVQYYWNNGATSSITTFNNPGVYYVMVTGANGCLNSDTIKIEHNGLAPKFQGIQIQTVGPYTFKFSAINPANVIGYAWDFGDGSPEVYLQNPTHTYTAKGNYLVRLRASSSCGITSDTMTTHIYSTAIDAIVLDDAAITIYPNPLNSTTTIATKDNVLMQKITLFNAIGQLMQSVDVNKQTTYQLDLSKFASGMYNVQVQTDRGIVNKKIEIIR